MKKFVSIALLMAIVLSCCACAKKQETAALEAVPATTLDAGSPEAMYGHIDQNTPVDGVYQIWNAEGIKSMSSRPDGSFLILCNIDMQGAELAPIGTEAAPFNGTLDGGNFVISNFSITGTDSSLGFVGTGKGKIQNVRLENVTVTASASSKFIGALAGSFEGTIQRCYVAGALTVENAAEGAICGSLVGKINGDIKNTEVVVDTTYSASAAATVAGIAGSVENSTMEYTQTNGKLTVTGSNKTVALFAGEAKNVTAYTLVFVGAENSLDGKLITNYFGTEEAVTKETMLVRDNSREPEQPHIQEKRQKVVDYMDAMALAMWRPRNDLVHSCTCQLSGCHGTFLADYTYFGPPYNHKGSSLYRMQYCTDEEGYLKPFVEYAGALDGYDMYIGSDCSSATLQAFLTVGTEVWFTQTQNENPYWDEYGTYAVGPYQTDVGQDKYTNGRETKQITEYNGEEVMYESYAQLRMGDGVCYWYNGYGHSRVCASDAVVVRDENGKINPDYSYIEMTEQGVTTIDDEAKTFTSWRHHWKYTFANLYNGYYVPFTIKEFMTGEFEEIDCKLENGSSDSRWSLTAGTITCNYSIDSVTMLITDDSGKEVYNHRLFTTVSKSSMDGSTHSRTRAPYKAFDMSNFATPLQQQMAFEQGETYHATITANLSTGDSIVVNDFTFTNG